MPFLAFRRTIAHTAFPRHDTRVLTACRHTCPCKPFYGVMGGVPPRIRVKYRIRAYRPSEGRSPVRARWMGGMSNSTAPACCHRGRRGSRECAHCTHHHAPRGRGRPRAVAASGRWRAMRRAAACERVTTSIRDGAFATGDIQEQPPRLSQPRPPFPACFQVTHRKIFLFSAVFRLRSPMFPAYVSATNTHPPAFLTKTHRRSHKPRFRMTRVGIHAPASRSTGSYTAFRHESDILFTRIRAFRPSKSRSPVRVRPGMRSMGARARSVNARNANMCPVGREPRARGWRHANSAGSHMGHGQHARLRDGASAMGSTRERPPRPRKPRPPFPACFQVTH